MLLFALVSYQKQRQKLIDYNQLLSSVYRKYSYKKKKNLSI